MNLIGSAADQESEDKAEEETGTDGDEYGFDGMPVDDNLRPAPCSLYAFIHPIPNAHGFVSQRPTNLCDRTHDWVLPLL
jgi:hypothetical protein